MTIHGDLTNVVMEIEDGNYTMTYEDEQGELHTQGGGGVALEPGGVERLLTADEILEDLDSPDVDFKKDGTVWVYYRNQSIDITDKFENHICYVKLIVKGKPMYMTIKDERENSFAYSTDWDDYPDPRKLD